MTKLFKEYECVRLIAFISGTDLILSVAFFILSSRVDSQVFIGLFLSAFYEKTIF